MKIDQIRKIARSLPEVTEEPHFDMTSFRVRGKIFATSPGDDVLHVFVDDVTRDQALTLFHEYMEKLYWGKKVAGLRINLRDARPAAVKEMLLKAWKNKAPRALRDQ